MAFEPLTPERRRRQTRDYLLQAAAKVFAERGFHGASLDEVAAVAGFTKGAVYSNFKNKEDLFLALLHAHYEHEMEGVRATLENSEGPVEEHLSDFADLVGGQFDDLGDDWAVLYQEFALYAMRNPAARAKLAAFDNLDVDSVAEIIATERVKRGITTPESPQHVARIALATMRGISIIRVLDPDAVDPAFLDSVMSFLARGMMSAPEQPPATRKAPAPGPSRQSGPRA